MSEHFDVIVVGSGAGGGVVAGELGRRGHRVALVEMGPHRTSRDFVRFEHEAFEHLFQPPREATTGDGTRPIAMVGGMCVGGSTTVNTKVGIRATVENVEAWHRDTGLLNDAGEPFSRLDLDPWYEQIEQRLGIRVRTDFSPSVLTVNRGFEKLGRTIEGTPSYTDFNCSQCGSCLQGCPTNAGRSTLTEWIQPAFLQGQIDLRAECEVREVLFAENGNGRPRARGVRYRDATGEEREIEAPIVVVACGSLLTPLLLQRSNLSAVAGDSASSRQVGRNLGTHTARMVHGLFDEPQDCHMVYPIMARCDDFIRHDDGGFVVEWTTILDPAGLAHNLVDEQERPLWGSDLVKAMERYRHWSGLFVQVKDSNGGTVSLTEDGEESFAKPLTADDRARLATAKQLCVDVLEAAGAREIVSTGLLTAHMQGSCRMGSDPERSALDEHQESRDVDGLFVADSSVIPSIMSVGPSLTIMALSLRLADHIETRLAQDTPQLAART